MKRILLYGNFDFLEVGVKYYKENNDYILLTVRTSTTFHHQEQILLDGIKYVKNDANLPMQKIFQREKVDILAVIAEHECIATMDEFNKTKLFCEDNNADLVVIKSFTIGGLVSVNPCNIYDLIRQLVKRKV